MASISSINHDDGDTPNILDLFLTSNPSTCSVKLSSQNPPKRRCFWHFNYAKWEDLRQYYSDFPWDDFCFHVRDPSLCAERITEIIISGMELYIPHTFFNTKAKKPWFNSACSRAVKDREAAHIRYRSHPSAETYALYTFARYHIKSILQLTKNSFINRKCQNLSNSNSSRGFFHLANNISNNFTSSSFSSLFWTRWSHSCLFFSLKLSSSLKLLLPTLFWMILGIFLLLLHPLTTSSLKLKFFIMTFSRLSLALILGRLTVWMESLQLFSKTVLPSSLSAWSNSFVCVSLRLPILLVGSLLTFNLSLKRMTAPILQTTAL